LDEYNPQLESETLYGDPKVPIVEPVLPLLDEWSRNVVINSCFKENEGKMKLIYPDILLLASTGVGHLEALSHYTWEQGMSILLDWEGFNLDPLIDKYYRDQDAQRALFAIKHCMYRQIIGGSIEGAHQNFIVRYQGGDRSLRITRGEEQRR